VLILAVAGLVASNQLLQGQFQAIVGLVCLAIGAIATLTVVLGEEFVDFLRSWRDSL
jgi:hypothetical protein